MNEKIDNYIKFHLSNDRYTHSLNVAKIAGIYADIYKLDKDMVIAIALFHDACKEMEKVEQLTYIKDNNLDKNLLQEYNKPLRHGAIASDIAIKNFSFTKEMAHAIYFHTTGCVNMSTLDKIIFLADKTEINRKYPDIDKLRKLSLQNLDKAMIMALEQIISKNKNYVNSLSIDALRDIKRRCNCGSIS